MSSDRLTCVVPTHNRPQFLRRLLRFYEQFSPGFSFTVIDSSASAAAAENRACIDSWKESAKIEYRHFDGNVIDKCFFGLQNVSTPYVIFCADDDFLLPRSVWNCVEFLEQHSGYESAIGWMSALNLLHPFAPWVVHQGYSIEDDLPFDRCRKIADFWFTNFYAVHRTTTLLEMFRHTADCTDSRETPHLAEQMLSLLSVLSGRVKVLPLISSVVACHGKNTSATTRSGVQADGERHYLRFRECVANQLEKTGVRRPVAEEFLDQSYGHFRDSQVANRRRRRSMVEHSQRFMMKMSHLISDYLGLNHNRRIAVKRLHRSSDDVVNGPELRQAQRLIQEFPNGISSDLSALRRVA